MTLNRPKWDYVVYFFARARSSFFLDMDRKTRYHGAFTSHLHTWYSSLTFEWLLDADAASAMMAWEYVTTSQWFVMIAIPISPVVAKVRRAVRTLHTIFSVFPISHECVTLCHIWYSSFMPENRTFHGIFKSASSLSRICVHSLYTPASRDESTILAVLFAFEMESQSCFSYLTFPHFLGWLSIKEIYLCSRRHL